MAVGTKVQIGDTMFAINYLLSPVLSLAMSQVPISLDWADMLPVHDIAKGAFAPPPNRSSLLGLTVAGYQGWFGTPNDDDNNGYGLRTVRGTNRLNCNADK